MDATSWLIVLRVTFFLQIWFDRRTHCVYSAQMMNNDWPKLSRALKQMSREGFFEFCSDIAEEITRRNNDLRDGSACFSPEHLIPVVDIYILTVVFLPSYNNVSLGRNHTRRKLASIPSRRFHELCMKICFEIGRRSPRRTKGALKVRFTLI